MLFIPDNTKLKSYRIKHIKKENFKMPKLMINIIMLFSIVGGALFYSLLFLELEKIWVKILFFLLTIFIIFAICISGIMIKNKINKKTFPKYFYFNSGALLLTDKHLEYEYGDSFYADTDEVVNDKDVYFNEDEKKYDKSECMRFKIKKEEIKDIIIQDKVCTVLGTGIIYNPYNFDCVSDTFNVAREIKCDNFSFYLAFMNDDSEEKIFNWLKDKKKTN